MALLEQRFRKVVADFAAADHDDVHMRFFLGLTAAVGGVRY
jgi:hypothetical protein